MLVQGADADVPTSVFAAQTRAIFVFGAFAMGLWVSDAAGGRIGPAWLMMTLAATALALACAVRRFAWLPMLLLSTALLGMGWHTLRTREASPAALARLVADGDVITVDGIVLDDPERIVTPRAGLLRFTHQAGGVRLRLCVRGLVERNGRVARASGVLWTRVDRDEHVTVRAGEAVRVTGLYRALSGPSNPGERDPRPLARQWGVEGALTLSSGALIVRLDDLPTAVRDASPMWQSVRTRAEGALRASQAALRARALAALDAASGRRAGATTASGAPDTPGTDDSGTRLLAGLLLGVYDDGSAELRDSFTRVGLTHVLSISGFHLAVMAALLLFVIRLTGDRGALEPLAVAVVVLLYLAIVPSGSPLARSAAMVLLMLVGEALGRRYDRLTILIWIALALLVWRPLDLWNLGYQLSMGLTALLLWRGRVFHERLWGAALRGTIVERPRSVFAKCVDGAKLSISCAILCWLVSTPLIVQATGMVSPLAILATVLLTPLIIAAMCAGYVLLVIGMVWPEAAMVPGLALDALARLIVTLVSWGSVLPGGAVRVWPLSGAWALCATMVALAWIAPTPEREGVARRNTRRWGRALATVLVVLMAGAGFWRASRVPSGVALRIDTLSVGNGTCHIIRSGGDAWVWDAGPMRGGGGVLPPLVAAARELGVWRVGTLVVTHPDTDHFAGAEVVLDELMPTRVLTPERTLAQAAAEPGRAAATLGEEFARRGVALTLVSAGDVQTLGEARVTFLSPPKDAAWPLDNDHSLVALLEVQTEAGPRRLLMTGDIGPAAIQSLLDAPPPELAQGVDIMELPHHGSVNEPSQRLTLSLNPRAVLQSTGKARAQDPRWNHVREGRTWLSTAEVGAAWVEIGTDGRLTAGWWGE